jgi:uncharacterized protein (TIGR00730 family)
MPSTPAERQAQVTGVASSTAPATRAAVAVYCGSSRQVATRHLDVAATTGRLLAAAGRRLVYGGGRVGSMGALADAALGAGGHVLGVIPVDMVAREVAHPGCSELVVVADMHERKRRMQDAADAFVALPGGAGTLDEWFEALTWGQVGHHAKPCALVNTDGFFDPLLGWLDRATVEGFLRPWHRDGIVVVDEPAGLLGALDAWVAPPSKWSGST